MAHIPIHLPHPVAWRNPVEMRASDALPAAGAWDATPTEQNIAGGRRFTLAFTYTRAAAGGAFDWQLEVSLYSVLANVPTDASEWITESVYASGAVAAGVDTQSRVQREYQTYVSQGADPEDFVYGPVEVHGTIERVRVRAKESGAVGNPGTLQITMEVY